MYYIFKFTGAYILCLVCFALCLSACKTAVVSKKIDFADNPVIAHRGAWKAKNLPQNSIASLKHAIELKCVGSEFDVRMTADNILIVTHDADFKGVDIETNTYAELSKQKLENGETLPTFKQYLEAGMQNNTSTGLVCEIKPSKIEGRGVIIAENVVKLVKELKAEPYILTYISFGYDILLKVKQIDANAKTQYLDGFKSPDELKTDGISGLDYIVWKLKQKPQWVESAKKHGLYLNAWTANTVENIDWLLANDFDFITTDQPELAFERLKKKE